MCSRNRHSQELREQTAKQDSNCHDVIQDSAAENCNRKKILI